MSKHTATGKTTRIGNTQNGKFIMYAREGGKIVLQHFSECGVYTLHLPFTASEAWDLAELLRSASFLQRDLEELAKAEAA